MIFQIQVWKPENLWFQWITKLFLLYLDFFKNYEIWTNDFYIMSSMKGEEDEQGNRLVSHDAAAN